MIDSRILLIGLFVGLANFLFRYLPLRFGKARQSGGKQGGKTGIILDSIGIASICALLIVSGVPDVMRDSKKLFPTLVGFLTICLIFYKTKKIILATLIRRTAFWTNIQNIYELGINIKRNMMIINNYNC